MNRRSDETGITHQISAGDHLLQKSDSGWKILQNPRICVACPVVFRQSRPNPEGFHVISRAKGVCKALKSWGI
jgi:hypothetical protein